MSSLTDRTDLREVVDVVIGVDTHVLTHSAAALNARTGGVPRCEPGPSKAPALTVPA